MSVADDVGRPCQRWDSPVVLEELSWTTWERLPGATCLWQHVHRVGAQRRARRHVAISTRVGRINADIICASAAATSFRQAKLGHPIVAQCPAFRINTATASAYVSAITLLLRRRASARIVPLSASAVLSRPLSRSPPAATHELAFLIYAFQFGPLNGTHSALR